MNRRRLLGCAMTVVAASCADFDGVVSSSHGPDIEVQDAQFLRDVYPIIERRCGVGGCHSELTHQAGLHLTRDSAYSALVNRSSRIVVGEVFVRPGDAANSWMIIAISDDAARRQGLARMPLASGALTQNQIRTIMNWINRGAPDD